MDVWKPAEHNGTFRGHQLSFVGAKAAIEYRERVGLDKKTCDNDGFIRSFLEERIIPLIPHVSYRGLGMIYGIDFSNVPTENASKLVAAECIKNGLIIERAGRQSSVLKILPPLTIDRNELTQGLEIIESAIKTVLGGK
jgi:diaminobutyrate-2-oxoglutarate transaminase